MKIKENVAVVKEKTVPTIAYEIVEELIEKRGGVDIDETPMETETGH